LFVLLTHHVSTNASDEDDHAALATSLGPVLDFMRQLWALNHALERTSKRMEASLGITAQQRIILRIVGKFPGLAPGRLSRILHVDAGTTSAALRRLEERKLLVRRKDSTDGRRISLVLTAAGRKLDQPTPGTVEMAVESVLTSSPARDVQAVHRLLERLCATMIDCDA
jgi:MarR family transcriptional regulator, organic hydroperoxide resistance regulator